MTNGGGGTYLNPLLLLQVHAPELPYYDADREKLKETGEENGKEDEELNADLVLAEHRPAERSTGRLGHLENIGFVTTADVYRECLVKRRTLKYSNTSNFHSFAIKLPYSLHLMFR